MLREIVSSPEDSALPKAVKIDNAGRWSLFSAPPLDPASIVAKDAMKPVATGDRLHVFYEPLPAADRTAVKRSATMPQELILRSFTSRLIIANGCLRLDMLGRPLVRFNAPPLIQIDPEAYLVLGGHRADGLAEYSRIGEEVIWFGGPFETGPEQESPPAAVTDPKAIAPIHAACGSGKVVSLPATVQSLALFRARQSDTAVEKFQEMYGVDEETARRKLGACGTTGSCGSPPPPVMDAKTCPKGSKIEFGLCRNADGHIRPIP